MHPAPHNLLVLQGGGPTPVLNITLASVIDEARRSTKFSRILGARHGIEGLLNSSLVDLTSISEPQLSLLRQSPGASLGTTRRKPSPAELEQALATLQKHHVRTLILIGGNGSLKGAQVIHEAARHANYDLRVIGCPKTIDNDILSTDRCPGFGSAARYVAQSVRDLGMDVRALPQPVSIYETMGRSVGWLAGAAALAKFDESSAPHLIYLPERPFHADRFLSDLDGIVRKVGYAIVIVAEGLKNPAGNAVSESTHASQTDALGRPLPGGVAQTLATLVTTELKIRCRSEKPGLCGRASILHLSSQDQRDADHVGRAGVRAALSGESGVMISLNPVDAHTPSRTRPLSDGALGERLLPHFLSDSPLAVSHQFIDYVKLCTGELLEYAVPLKDQVSS